MSFLRVTALRSAPPAVFTRTVTRAIRRSASQPCMRLGQQTGRRGYASAVDTVKKTSDLPWLATATVVTAFGTYIALSPSEGGSHGHDDEHHDDHKDEESAEKPENEDGGSEEKDSKDDGGGAEDKNKSDGEEESKESKDKGDSGSSESFKDDTNAEEDSGTKGDTQKGTSPDPSKQVADSKGPEDTAKLHKGAIKDKSDVKHRESDEGKGATKVRIDSPNQKTLGQGVSSGEGDEQTHRQRGFSNTDTKHSTDPNADKGKSSKGEGTVETAKVKGTVQPDRPQK